MSDSNLSKQNGAFSWCELITSDLAGAKEFYGKLFGWQLETCPMEGMEYTMIKVGDREIGGMMTTPPEAEGMPSTWGTYVTVADVDFVAAEAEKIGGKVLVAPQDIPDVGRFCVILDPQGAFISAITYGHSE